MTQQTPFGTQQTQFGTQQPFGSMGTQQVIPLPTTGINQATVIDILNHIKSYGTMPMTVAQRIPNMMFGEAIQRIIYDLENLQPNAQITALQYILSKFSIDQLRYTLQNIGKLIPVSANELRMNSASIANRISGHVSQMQPQNKQVFYEQILKSVLTGSQQGQTVRFMGGFLPFANPFGQTQVPFATTQQQQQMMYKHKQNIDRYQAEIDRDVAEFKKMMDRLSHLLRQEDANRRMGLNTRSVGREINDLVDKLSDLREKIIDNETRRRIVMKREMNIDTVSMGDVQNFLPKIPPRGRGLIEALKALFGVSSSQIPAYGPPMYPPQYPQTAMPQTAMPQTIAPQQSTGFFGSMFNFGRSQPQSQPQLQQPTTGMFGQTIMPQPQLQQPTTGMFGQPMTVQPQQQLQQPTTGMFGQTAMPQTMTTQQQPLGSVRGTLSQQDIMAVQQKNMSINNILTEVRKVIDMPANYINPENFMKWAQELASKVNLQIQDVYDESRMGGIRAIGKGSTYRPRLLQITYRGQNSSNEPTLLVGKGVTFDSGGYNLKPSRSILGMKRDKTGASIALGVICCLAAIRAPCHVVALLPMVENAIGANASKPGDVATLYDGKTIEIVDTDAEGRVILADAIAYGMKALSPRPSEIIDIATLTSGGGLCGEYAPIVGNRKRSLEFIRNISEQQGERMWPMPLTKEYVAKTRKNTIANVKNLSTCDGPVMAGAFLANFIPTNTPWIHIDIGHSKSFFEDSNTPGSDIYLNGFFTLIRYFETQSSLAQQRRTGWNQTRTVF
jgi:leucyl aminopeptidase